MDLDLMGLAETWLAPGDLVPMSGVVVNGHAPIKAGQARGADRQVQAQVVGQDLGGRWAAVKVGPVILVVAYLPPMVEDLAAARRILEEFDTYKEGIAQQVPGTPVVIMGDFNARMGVRTGDGGVCADPQNGKGITDFVMVNLAAVALGPELMVHEEMTLGSDHSLLVFTVNVPTGCFKALFSQALEKNKAAVTHRLAELKTEVVPGRERGNFLTWEQRGQVVNEASTLGGSPREKVDTPHLTALKEYAAEARRNFLVADPDKGLMWDLSVDTNKIHRAAVPTNRQLPRLSHAKTPLENRSLIALDPSKLPRKATGADGVFADMALLDIETVVNPILDLFKLITVYMCVPDSWCLANVALILNRFPEVKALYLDIKAAYDTVDRWLLGPLCGVSAGGSPHRWGSVLSYLQTQGMRGMATVVDLASPTGPERGAADDVQRCFNNNMVSLHLLTNLPTMAARNYLLNAGFFFRLHQSTDLSNLAARIYRKSLTGGPAPTHCGILSVLFSIHFSSIPWSLLPTNSPTALQATSTVKPHVSYPSSAAAASIRSYNLSPYSNDPNTPCANCEEETPCSRAHAVVCSGVDGLLFGLFPAAADPNEDLGETLLDTAIASLRYEIAVRRDAVTRRQIRLCVKGVERIRWACGGQQPLWDICDNGVEEEVTQLFVEAGQARPISPRTPINLNEQREGFGSSEEMEAIGSAGHGRSRDKILKGRERKVSNLRHGITPLKTKLGSDNPLEHILTLKSPRTALPSAVSASSNIQGSVCPSDVGSPRSGGGGEVLLDEKSAVGEERVMDGVTALEASLVVWMDWNQEAHDGLPRSLPPPSPSVQPPIASIHPTHPPHPSILPSFPSILSIHPVHPSRPSIHPSCPSTHPSRPCHRSIHPSRLPIYPSIPYTDPSIPSTHSSIPSAHLTDHSGLGFKTSPRTPFHYPSPINLPQPTLPTLPCTTNNHLAIIGMSYRSLGVRVPLMIMWIWRKLERIEYASPMWSMGVQAPLMAICIQLVYGAGWKERGLGHH
ncbi:hypothetical protein BC829DRAFT_448544 [Chytridium lagenaria]|nr:hypothetical protein BC829DRAFT_448544 [Chytridium lagenaria]